MRKSLFMLSALVLAVATTEAKQTRLRPSDQGVLGAMARMDCSPGWLAPAMKKSGIRESELNRLLEGRRIIAPNSCDDSDLSEADRLASVKVLQRQDARVGTAKLQKENEVLRRDLILQNKQLTSARENANRLSSRVEGLEKDLAALAKTLTEPLPMRTLIKPKFLATLTLLLVLGVAIGGLAGMLWHRQVVVREVETRYERRVVRDNNENAEAIPRRVVHEHNGERVVFRFVGTAYYQCSLCLKENIQEPNLVRHLHKVHSAEPAEEDQSRTVRIS